MNKFKKRGIPAQGSSYSSEYLANRNAVPQVSALMVQGISKERKLILEDEVSQGKFNDGTGPRSNEDGFTSNAVVSASIGFKKTAQVVSGGGGFNGNAGDSVKQTPEVYSPLWLSSNINLPRDRATINAWCRSFYALNPFVHNAINLHSTYPISKLQIKCHNPEVQKFFNDMIEELDLMNICVQIAQEFWLLGESFVYAELDESKGKWNRLLIQNPDYMIVKRTVIANEPIIMLRPDNNLQQIVKSNKPSDIEQRKQLNQHIIESVRRGGNIPLDNFHVSHLARKISPYEIRGTGLPVCIFRQLMLMDRLRESKFAQADNLVNPLTLVKIGSADFKPTFADLEAWREIFECHDEETEVLTDAGFKKFDEVIEFQEVMDGTYNTSYISYAIPKNGIKIACFNPDNEQLEYHSPLNASLYNYDGDMYHFSNKKIDIKVTPNHDMFVSQRDYNSKYLNWKKVKAKDLKINNYNKLRSQVKWQGESPEFIKIFDKNIPSEIYLEYLGYLLSEGSIYINNRNYNVDICQSTKKYHLQMKKCLESFANHLHVKTHQCIRNNGMWSGTISNKELFFYFKNQIGQLNNTTSKYKKVPDFVKTLSPKLLKILLNALICGDGHVSESRVNKIKISRYTTISKQLSDDVYEIAYKAGYTPLLSVSKRLTQGGNNEYSVTWSENGKGNYPLVHYNNNSHETNPLKIERYNGKVWCFEVPTGLFITRRNGKITIQGNSAQYDKDFKIFTHEGVTVERVGAGSGIYDISGDITQLIKEIYVGLQVPSSLMDGGSDTTYANAGVALDVLRQRYMQFRNMLSSWLRRKIFAPISKIQGFYEYKPGSSRTEKHLIVPEIDWNHMSLFDAGDYIQNLVQLTQPVPGAPEGSPNRVSNNTLYRSLGLEEEDEVRKLRKEAIRAEIYKKELAALTAMPLNALRSLDDDEDIPEPVATEVAAGAEAPVPGEMPGLGSDMGLPGLGGSLPPPPPPPPKAPGGGSKPPSPPPPK